MTNRSAEQRRARISANIDKAVEDLEIYSAEQLIRSFEPTAVHNLRRTSGPSVGDNLGTMTLYETDGVLRWAEGLAPRDRRQIRRRRHGPRRVGNVVKQLKFERLDQNSVGKALRILDRKLNKHEGIRSWSESNRGRKAIPKKNGRVLLLVHGTFSKTEVITDALRSTKWGKRFLARARKNYDQILSFDHPTLSIPPVMNAVDLSRHFAASEAQIDIVCHSRGGLVARWWVEELNYDPRRIGRVVFVGSPLAGTGLAAPPRLRSSLDLLTNVANVLGKGSQAASTAIPLFAVVTGILKIVGSVTKAMSKTPIIDATISMIPGLAAQSQTGDNASIIRLREGIEGLPTQPYYAVATSFEPQSPGWAFWQYFQNPLGRLANAGADYVFEGDNDLVVDTSSMTELSDRLDIPKTNTMPPLPHKDIVHHLNYFEQPEVIDFLEKTLRLE